MEVSSWIAEHWFDLIQTVVIVGGLFYTAYSLRRDEQARTVANMIAINDHYTEIWSAFYDRPDLARVLASDADLKGQPVSATEMLFVKTLLLHLDVVRRTMNAGVFIQIQGLQNDIRDFLELPIPKAVWAKIKPYQDKDFVKFIENSLRD
jgi:hypothetical protein